MRLRTVYGCPGAERTSTCAGPQRGLRSPIQQPVSNQSLPSGPGQVVTYTQPQALPSTGNAPERALPAGTYVIQQTANATVYRPILDTNATIVPDSQQSSSAPAAGPSQVGCNQQTCAPRQS